MFSTGSWEHCFLNEWYNVFSKRFDIAEKILNY